MQLQLSICVAVNFLVNHRLQWGKPDTLSLIPSALHESKDIHANNAQIAPAYFQADIPFYSDLICIIQNDWPYSGIYHAFFFAIGPCHSFFTFF